MIKYLFFLLLVCCVSVGYSQTGKAVFKPFVEAGGGPGTGITHDLYPIFLNFRGGVYYRISEKTDLKGGTGYTQFFRRKNKKGASFLPLAAGVDYRMSSNIFVEMQLGGALLIEDRELYLISEPGMGWLFNLHHSLKVSYYGFITNGLVIGGINFSYRYNF